MACSKVYRDSMQKLDFQISILDLPLFCDRAVIVNQELISTCTYGGGAIVMYP